MNTVLRASAAMVQNVFSDGMERKGIGHETIKQAANRLSGRFTLGSNNGVASGAQASCIVSGAKSQRSSTNF
jgi:hypothetical protein